MLHKQTWNGSGSATITDMTNAGKRGKTCDQIRFCGWLPHGEDARVFADFTRETLAYVDALTGAEQFADIAAEIERRVAQFNDRSITCCRQHIRGVDAPRPRLIAGVPGKWSGHADHEGVTIDEDADQSNQPCIITHHSQKDSACYERAASVWDRVKTCATFSQVWEVLREAGCKMHYYCRMD